MSDLLDQPLSVLHNLYTTNTTEEDFPAFARKHLNPKIISSFKVRAPLSGTLKLTGLI